MPVIPDDAVQQLGELPVVVAVLLISLIALVATVWIVMRLLATTETSRREERQSRDQIFLAFLAEQRNLDRDLGKQTADTFSKAIDRQTDTFGKALEQVSDSTRDGTTATLAMLERMSEKVDDALNISTDAIREANSALSKMGREIEIMREAHGDQHEGRGKR